MRHRGIETLAAAVVVMAVAAFLVWAILFGPVGAGAAPGAW